MNRVTFSVVAIMLLAAATTLPFVLNAGFGKAPQGVQLSQVEASPHYRDGQFHNQLPTPGFTGQKNMLAAWWDFLMTKRENARPAQPLPLVKTDLATLPLGQDVMVWLGHSSWYLQLAGKRILIDPVFSDYAAPFSFINKAFPGDYPWRAEGMPEIDLLIISTITTTIWITPPFAPYCRKLSGSLRRWGRIASALLGNGRGADYRSGLAAGGTGQRRAHRPRAAGAAHRPWAEA